MWYFNVFTWGDGVVDNSSVNNNNASSPKSEHLLRVYSVLGVGVIAQHALVD